MHVPGRTYADHNHALVLHKLDAAGTLDESFGNNGVVTATLTTDSNYLAIDHLFGDGGHDTSVADENDILASIESRT